MYAPYVVIYCLMLAAAVTTIWFGAFKVPWRSGPENAALNRVVFSAH